NAFQALDPEREGRVTITAETQADRIIVRVRDDGVGMSDDVRRRLGEPFFSTKPVGQGTGLGLAVSFGLVKSMGGRLSFESQPGQGTTALLDLQALGESDRERSSSRLSTAQGQTLLLVDDDEVVLRSLVRTLSQVYEVTPARSIEEAELRLNEGDFDFVLCDVMMPDGGAPTLYAWLEREHPSQAQRTIFLTGGASSVTAREFLERGIQPVLSKPFTVAELVEITRRLTAEQ
ncbi:MAG TPA: ATP-binding protein, partial [Polyangiaceae bacterium]|nr:ATP-binding protein [Polyangiaceae bacterium]